MTVFFVTLKVPFYLTDLFNVKGVTLTLKKKSIFTSELKVCARRSGLREFNLETVFLFNTCKL